MYQHGPMLSTHTKFSMTLTSALTLQKEALLVQPQLLAMLKQLQVPVVLVLVLDNAELLVILCQAEVPVVLAKLFLTLSKLYQTEFPLVLSQAEMPVVLSQAEMPALSSQAEMPAVLSQENIPMVLSQAELPPVPEKAEVAAEFNEVHHDLHLLSTQTEELSLVRNSRDFLVTSILEPTTETTEKFDSMKIIRRNFLMKKGQFKFIEMFFIRLLSSLRIRILVIQIQIYIQIHTPS